ncbi:DDE-type integrase/transposase/recombinase [Marinifilum sp. N1E240]|uniref:DDE-type integrase/transposase/recombinase n=1 Tax=Marinifilum sp. N1E240 TaxID=2608082 RepID=UPI00128D3B7E|nr:DDE-type integrase/transposase/recombinase [Marinifilum sp. N1E240]MPQ45546.1 DDE-type integrase/transposase/recombinase [Marinifilum sp. N1E240]
MEQLYITKDEKVVYKSKDCTIVKIISIDKVMIQENFSNIIHTVSIKELEKPEENTQRKAPEILLMSDQSTERANKIYEIIEPLIDKKNTSESIACIANKHNVSSSSIYRWLKIIRETGLVSSLAGYKKKGGAGKSRLLKVQEDIIQDKIHSVYLTSSRKSIQKTIIEIKLACDDFGINPPSERTIRRRIQNISEETKVKKRLGSQEAKYKFAPIKGCFPGATHPLAIVQIDHTPVDIILVDEQNRKPYKKPYLTCAIDVYSRVVVGFYLSFDSPGVLATGICLSNSILPKEIWLEKRNIKAEWPCWGVMDTIHLDNAKEFKSKSLRKICKNYGINIVYRPVGSPHYGGHIERLLGTFSKEIHNLPGTTFSNVQERKRYQSEKNSSFTLKEFEKWLAIYITKIYHIRTHSAINTSPLEKYKSGYLTNNGKIKLKIPPRIKDERKVRLDFLPLIERSIQEYGVLIDHIYYFSDILRNYIHDTEGKNKVKHIFKRDPRDISLIYFLDPKQQEYYEIPYRNPSNPPISLWEHRKIRKALTDKNIQIDERVLFQAYRELNEIEERAIRNTRRERKKNPIIKKNNIPVKTTNEEIDTDQEYLTIEPFKNLSNEPFE